MELWIRSTAKTNLLKAKFLTIMSGNNFYKKYDWEYDGYTICNCTENGRYELLGTYKTKERAKEVLDEIQKIIHLKDMYINDRQEVLKVLTKLTDEQIADIRTKMSVYEMPEE